MSRVVQRTREAVRLLKRDSITSQQLEGILAQQRAPNAELLTMIRSACDQVFKGARCNKLGLNKEGFMQQVKTRTYEVDVGEIRCGTQKLSFIEFKTCVYACLIDAQWEDDQTKRKSKLVGLLALGLQFSDESSSLLKTIGILAKDKALNALGDLAGQERDVEFKEWCERAQTDVHKEFEVLLETEMH